MSGGNIAAVVGFAPAIVWMLLISQFEGLFDHRKLVLCFGGGMAFGMPVGMFYGLLGGYLETLDLSVLSFVFFLPLFTESGKMAVLNSKRFRLRLDTIFYGTALGAGLGCMMSVYIAYRTFYAFPYLTGELKAVFLLFVLSLSLSLIHLASGCIIGIYAFNGAPWQGFLRAITVQAAFFSVILPYMWGVSLFFLPFALGYSIFVTYAVIYRIVPEAFPEEIKRKMRRERRKLQQKPNKGEEGSR